MSWLLYTPKYFDGFYSKDGPKKGAQSAFNAIASNSFRLCVYTVWVFVYDICVYIGQNVVHNTFTTSAKTNVVQSIQHCQD